MKNLFHNFKTIIIFDKLNSLLIIIIQQVVKINLKPQMNSKALKLINLIQHPIFLT